MSEADLLAMSIDGTDAIVQLVAAAFTIISAYIAGLYFFLRRAPLPLRLAAFGLVSITLAFLGMLAFGLFGVLVGADTAWRVLPETVSGVESLGGVRPPWLGGLSFYEAGATLGYGAFGLIYLALAYVTFVYRWQER